MPLDEESIERDLRAADGFAADGRPRAALERLRALEHRLEGAVGEQPEPWIRGALVRVEQSRAAIQPALEAWEETLRERERRYRERELAALRAGPTGAGDG